jgi:hypothetical protein
MRLVIRNRRGSTAGGLRRYNGSGLFSSIGRKLFSSGLKKVINVATKANLPQKIANVVVNGAQSAGQKFGKTVGQKLTKFAGEKLGEVAGEKVADTVKETLKRKFTPVEQQVASPPSKQTKIDINHLINGSGIVFD